MRLPATMADMWAAERQGPGGLSRRQRTRLLELLSHTRAHSPYYAALYADLPADAPLEDLPVVSKKGLMAAFDDWLTDPALDRRQIERFLEDPARAGHTYRGQYFVCTTSGTTGRPGIFLHDHDAQIVYRALVYARLEPRWVPLRTWPKMLRHRLRWVAVVGTGAHFAGVGWMQAERLRYRWRRQAYRVFSIQQPVDQLVAQLNAYDPAVITIYPSGLEQLCAEQRSGRLHIRPVMIEVRGESLLPEVAERARTVFGCPVREVYAASECMFMAFSCDAGWMHVNADWIILEPVTTDLRPTPPGQPSDTVLLTNLANRVQPLIRYDLGDSVLHQPGPCRCGSRLPAIKVSGRQDDVMHLVVDGRTIDVLPLSIGTVVDATPGIQRCQLLQAGPSTIRVRLQTDAAHVPDTVWDDLIHRLRGFLDTLGAGGVEIVRTAEPPASARSGGKFRRVIAGNETGGSVLA